MSDNDPPWPYPPSQPQPHTPQDEPSASNLATSATAAIALVLCSGAFSGLTLGLLSLSLESLELLRASGTDEQKKWAKRIYPVRSRGNLLLCTLLLGNTIVNVLISMLSGQLLSPAVGTVVGTLVIFVFGEILPQSVCSRHGLRVGAASVWLIVPLMALLSPVTLPIAWLLDRLVGSEMRTMYNKRQLGRLLEMQELGDDPAITGEDRQLLSGALTFAEKSVGFVMTKLVDVFMIPITASLDFDTLKSIYTSGYTRIPVYRDLRSRVVGLLFAKDLILVDPNDEIPVSAFLALASPASINAAPMSTMLDKMLQEVQRSHSHMWFIVDELTSDALGPRASILAADGVVGIVTMEDIMEELISDEIIDESDTITDNATRRAVVELRAPRRMEFFEMLQRRDELSGGSVAPMHVSRARATADEVRALASYLGSNVPQLRAASGVPLSSLRRLIQRCPVHVVSAEEVARGCYLFVRGVPANFCCLALHGRIQVHAGNEGFASDIGPWTPLAANALGAAQYVPDYTARVATQARIFIVYRSEFLAIQSSSEPARGLLGPPGSVLSNAVAGHRRRHTAISSSLIEGRERATMSSSVQGRERASSAHPAGGSTSLLGDALNEVRTGEEDRDGVPALPGEVAMRAVRVQTSRGSRSRSS